MVVCSRVGHDIVEREHLVDMMARVGTFVEKCLADE